MQAGAEIITAEILLLEFKLAERMRAVDDRFNAFRAGHLADGLYRCDLSSDVYLMGDQDQLRAIGNPTGKSGRDLIEVLWRNRNLDQFQLQTFAPLALAQSRQHARIVLGGGENLVA